MCSDQVSPTHLWNNNLPGMIDKAHTILSSSPWIIKVKKTNPVNHELWLDFSKLSVVFCWLSFWLPCISHWWSSWSSTSQSSSAPQTPSGSWSWSCQPRRHGPSRRTEPRLAPPRGESWECWCLAWEWGIYQKDGKGHPRMGLWGLRGGR